MIKHNYRRLAVKYLGIFAVYFTFLYTASVFEDGLFFKLTRPSMFMQLMISILFITAAIFMLLSISPIGIKTSLFTTPKKVNYYITATLAIEMYASLGQAFTNLRYSFFEVFDISTIDEFVYASFFICLFLWYKKLANRAPLIIAGTAYNVLWTVNAFRYELRYTELAYIAVVSMFMLYAMLFPSLKTAFFYDTAFFYAEDGPIDAVTISASKNKLGHSEILIINERHEFYTRDKRTEELKKFRFDAPDFAETNIYAEDFSDFILDSMSFQ